MVASSPQQTKVGKRTFYGSPIVDKIVKRITRKRAVPHSYGTRYRSSKPKNVVASPKKVAPLVGFPLVRQEGEGFRRKEFAPLTLAQRQAILDSVNAQTLGELDVDEDKVTKPIQDPKHGKLIDVDTEDEDEDDSESCYYSSEDELVGCYSLEFLQDELEKSIERCKILQNKQQDNDDLSEALLCAVASKQEEDLTVTTVKDDDLITIEDDCETVEDDQESVITIKDDDYEEEEEFPFKLVDLSLE